MPGSDAAIAPDYAGRYRRASQPRVTALPTPDTMSYLRARRPRSLDKRRRVHRGEDQPQPVLLPQLEHV